MIAEMMDVESWERLAANAATEHEKNLATRNALQRQRAAAALSGLMTGDTSAVAGIDDELCAVEARIVGHAQTMKLIRLGLDAATTVACSDSELAKVALTRANVAKRSELAHQVDEALEGLANIVCAYLDSSAASSVPARVAGDLNRAYWAAFAKARNRPAWARRAVADMSAAPHSMATVRPLASTTDPALNEADTLETAALKRRAEAQETLKALTLPKPLPTAKSRQNRPVAAELEAAA